MLTKENGCVVSKSLHETAQTIILAALWSKGHINFTTIDRNKSKYYIPNDQQFNASSSFYAMLFKELSIDHISIYFVLSMLTKVWPPIDLNINIIVNIDIECTGGSSMMAFFKTVNLKKMTRNDVLDVSRSMISIFWDFWLFI